MATIYANDNCGIWQSDFHSLVSACLGMAGSEDAKRSSLKFMAGVLKCDVKAPRAPRKPVRRKAS